MPEVWKLCEADLSSAKTHNINRRKAKEGTRTYAAFCSLPSVNANTQHQYLKALCFTSFMSQRKESENGVYVHPGCSGIHRDLPFICLTTVCSRDYVHVNGVLEGWVCSGAARAQLHAHSRKSLHSLNLQTTC